MHEDIDIQRWVYVCARGVGPLDSNIVASDILYQSPRCLIVVLMMPRLMEMFIVSILK